MLKNGTILNAAKAILRRSEKKPAIEQNQTFIDTLRAFHDPLQAAQRQANLQALVKIIRETRSIELIYYRLQSLFEIDAPEIGLAILESPLYLNQLNRNQLIQLAALPQARSQFAQDLCTIRRIGSAEFLNILMKYYDQSAMSGLIQNPEFILMLQDTCLAKLVDINLEHIEVFKKTLLTAHEQCPEARKPFWFKRRFFNLMFNCHSFRANVLKDEDFIINATMLCPEVDEFIALVKLMIGFAQKNQAFVTNAFLSLGRFIINYKDKSTAGLVCNQILELEDSRLSECLLSSNVIRPFLTGQQLKMMGSPYDAYHVRSMIAKDPVLFQRVGMDVIVEWANRYKQDSLIKAAIEPANLRRLGTMQVLQLVQANNHLLEKIKNHLLNVVILYRSRETVFWFKACIEALLLNHFEFKEHIKQQPSVLAYLLRIEVQGVESMIYGCDSFAGLNAADIKVIYEKVPQVRHKLYLCEAFSEYKDIKACICADSTLCSDKLITLGQKFVTKQAPNLDLAVHCLKLGVISRENHSLYSMQAMGSLIILLWGQGNYIESLTWLKIAKGIISIELFEEGVTWIKERLPEDEQIKARFNAICEHKPKEYGKSEEAQLLQRFKALSILDNQPQREVYFEAHYRKSITPQHHQHRRRNSLSDIKKVDAARADYTVRMAAGNDEPPTMDGLYIEF